MDPWICVLEHEIGRDLSGAFRKQRLAWSFLDFPGGSVVKNPQAMKKNQELQV